MDTNAIIVIILDVGMALFLVYGVYNASRSRAKKPVIAAPEIKPTAAAVEPVKPEPVPPPLEPKASVVAVTPRSEPVKMAPDPAPPAAVESPKPVQAPKPKVVPKPKPARQSTERKEQGFNIIDIEGIGKVYSEKLHAINLYHTADLLKAGATPQGRRELADKTGISHELILKWVNLSDLFRIKGIGEEYSDLLEEAGVDTVVELSHRNAANLHAKILEVNEAKKLVRRPPPLASVEGWITEAKTLPRVIEY